MKNWTLLENKRDYESALKRIDALMELNPGTKTELGKEMRLLVYLVDRYEEEHYPIGMPDPIEAIKTRMEDLGLEPKDLIEIIGDKGTVSKVLNNRIPLSLRMIRNLTKKLQLPAEILIQEPNLVEA